MTASTAKRSAVGEAMRLRMRELGLSYPALAQALADVQGGPPVSDTAVLKWLGKPERLEPSRLFALERALQVPPGTYSRGLGYIPADAPSGTSEDAIRSDGRLSERDRIIVLATLYSCLRTPEG